MFRYLERIVGHDLALRMQAALRVRVYDKLAATTLIGRRRGDLLTRVVADIDAVLDVVVRVAVPFAAGGVVVLGPARQIAPGGRLQLAGEGRRHGHRGVRDRGRAPCGRERGLPR